MALHDITLTYGGLSVAFRNWKSADLPRSRRTFVTESSAAIDIATTGSSSVLNTQLFVRLDDESEEIAERNATALTKTRSSVAGTTPRELNGGVYYYARFLADWVAPPEFGKAYSSVKLSPNNSVVADQVKVRAVALVLQDTGVKI